MQPFVPDEPSRLPEPTAVAAACQAAFHTWSAGESAKAPGAAGAGKQGAA